VAFPQILSAQALTLFLAEIEGLTVRGEIRLDAFVILGAGQSLTCCSHTIFAGLCATSLVKARWVASE
jgi:hypothetical protein